MLFSKGKKRSYTNSEIRYITKQLSKAKAYDKKTAFVSLSDKDLIACFEDGDFFVSLSKAELQQLFQEVVTRISNGNGYITPTAKVEMYSEKQMIKKSLQNDSLVVRARCNLNNVIDFFLPEKKVIDNLSKEEKKNFGLMCLFDIYHETVHARQFINMSKLFNPETVKSLKPFDKYVALYEVALISNKILNADVRLVEDYVDTVNELEANMRAYAVFKQNIDHGCFKDTQNAIDFINEKIVQDCAYNSNIQQFAENTMKVTDCEMLEFEYAFRSKINKSIVKAYAEIDRSAVSKKLHKYNGYLLEAFDGFFKDFVQQPNTPDNIKKMYDKRDFAALKAIKLNRDIIHEAEKSVRETFLSEEELIADEIEKINKANAKILYNKDESVASTSEKEQNETKEKEVYDRESQKKDIIDFLSDNKPENKKIKDDAQK